MRDGQVASLVSVQVTIQEADVKVDLEITVRVMKAIADLETIMVVENLGKVNLSIKHAKKIRNIN